MSMDPDRSRSISLIMSSASASVAASPNDLMTAPSSCLVMLPVTSR